MPAPLVKVLRNEIVESIHYGHIVILGHGGEVAASLGDPDFLTFFRSCAKPFQAIPVVTSGAAEKFGFSEKELSIFCGSLNGQDYQVAVLRHIMELIDVTEDHLQCGVHRPSHRPTAWAMAKAGEKPTAIHNNCAGKHLAMLALCRFYGWPLETYTNLDHPVQKLMRNVVAGMCDLAPEQLGVGVDGCGVPVFAAPLKKLARGYLRLATAADSAADENERASARLMAAACKYPEMIAGDERICTEAMRAAHGRLFAKTGAEGSYGLALPELSMGIAFKITDGAQRSIAPVVVEILRQLSVIDTAGLESLRKFHDMEILNHRKETVGRIEPDFKLDLSR